MANLIRAVELAGQIRAGLAVEVERARQHRVLIRTMNADALFQHAHLRGAFNVRLAELEQEVADELSAFASATGLTEVTFEALGKKAPAATRNLTDIFAEVRSLAGALHELDILNRELAERALTLVRGYVTAVSGGPMTYDRRGATTAGTATLSTAVRVV